MSSALEVDIRLHQGKFALAADFSAPAGGITALFGPSGGGKSTLLSALAGLKQCQGHIRFGNRTIADSNKGLFLAPHRRGIGLVFQEARLFPHLTVRQNIGYAWKRAPADRRPAIEDIAGFFDITAHLDRPVSNLSGGEKSRVALARAIASAPDYLLLDEPFAALDGTRRRAFIEVLLAMHQNYALPIMIVTHQIEEAAALASHVIALGDGRVVAEGSFSEATQTAGFRSLLDARDIGAAVPARLLRAVTESALESYWLRADQVMLAGEKPAALSARNILAGTIKSLQIEAQNSVLVEVETEAGYILSRVTAEAVSDLAMAPGKPIWSLVKMHAL